jgi:hypothetical protein
VNLAVLALKIAVRTDDQLISAIERSQIQHHEVVSEYFFDSIDNISSHRYFSMKIIEYCNFISSFNFLNLYGVSICHEDGSSLSDQISLNIFELKMKCGLLGYVIVSNSPVIVELFSKIEELLIMNLNMVLLFYSILDCLDQILRSRIYLLYEVCLELYLQEHVMGDQAIHDEIVIYFN